MFSTFACYFLPSFPFFFFLLSVLWACLEISHNAQPHKLTDSCMGHGVIRWRQLSLSIQSVSRSAVTASLISCFCLPTCVINTTPLLRKCLRTCWFLTPLPPVNVCVLHPIRFCSSTHIATAFRCYKGIYNAFLQHICRIEMPNAALFLFCFQSSTSFDLSELGAGFEEEKPSDHWEFFTSFDALLWYCLDHCTKKIVCIPIENEQQQWFPVKCQKNKKSLET